MIQTNLKELLNRNNISINKLSIETGLSRPTLTSLMNNESKGIQFDTLEKLLDYFNISISDFLASTMKKLSSISYPMFHYPKLKLWKKAHFLLKEKIIM